MYCRHLPNTLTCFDSLSVHGLASPIHPYHPLPVGGTIPHVLKAPALAPGVDEAPILLKTMDGMWELDKVGLPFQLNEVLVTLK